MPIDPVSPPDADLLRRFTKHNDRDALGALFIRHAPFAFRTAYLILHERGAAEDAVQDACLRLIKDAGAFDPARPFLPWFKTLVARSALDLARRTRRREAREVKAPAPSTPEDPAMPLINREAREHLCAELARLPEELRLPTILHYQAGYSYAEIAQSLACPEGTVATRLASARERLKAGLSTAGVLLAAGMSMEEAVTATAPVIPVPLGLPAALEALAHQEIPGRPEPAPPSRAALKPLVLAASALILAGGGLFGFLARPEKPPTAPADRGHCRIAQPDPVQASVRPGKSIVEAPPRPISVATPSPAGAPAAAATIEGRVTCKETGLAIPGAKVHLEFRSEPAEIRQEQEEERGGTKRRGMSRRSSMTTQVTDAEGRYRFVIAEPGDAYALDIDARGYLFPRQTLREKDTNRPCLFEALSPGETRRHDLALSHGWGLKLTLNQPDGNPAKNPVLTLITEPGDGREDRGPMISHLLLEHPTGITNAVHHLPDGSYEVLGIDPQHHDPQRTRVTVAARGTPVSEPVALNTIPCTPGSLYILDLALRVGRNVQGIVLGPDGMPFPDTYILCRPAQKSVAGQDGSEKTGAAGPDGRFEIRGLPADKPLLLWAQGSLFAFLKGQEACDTHTVAMKAPFRLEAGAGDAPVTLRLDADGQVWGRVVDTLGNPLAGVEVSSYFRSDISDVSRNVKTAADGTFVIKGLPPWKGLRVVAYHPRDNNLIGGFRHVPVGTKGLCISLSIERSMNAIEADLTDYSP